MVMIIVLNTCMISEADGWNEGIDGWYYEENGAYTTSAWRKGEKGYYYLDQKGRLTTDSWIADEEKKYYVDVEGLRMKNQWLCTGSWEDSDISSNYWYYFDSNGEMMTGKQQIGDKKYFFSEDGKMLTGWITYEEGEAENLSEEISHGDTYYCQEDGSRVSGWFQLEPPMDEEKTGAEYWYNFEDNGKIRRNTKTNIGDYDFCFDELGRMIDGWAYQCTETDVYVKVDDNTDSQLLDQYNNDVNQYYYCGEEDIGVVQKNIWLNIVPPGKEGNPDEDLKWYYFDKKGKIEAPPKASPSEATPSHADRILKVRKVKNAGEYGLNGEDGDLLNVILKKIDGNYYLIDTNGQIVDDLVYIYNQEGSYRMKEGYYYFGTDSSKTTGKVKKENDGMEYDYYFAKKTGNGYSEGQGVTGIYNGKLYYKGLAAAAQYDREYKLVYIPELAGDTGTGLFVVDERGKVKASGLTSKLDDGTRYRIKRSGHHSGFLVYKVEDKYKDEVLLQAEDADEILDFNNPELIV